MAAVVEVHVWPAGQPFPPVPRRTRRRRSMSQPDANFARGERAAVGVDQTLHAHVGVGNGRADRLGGEHAVGVGDAGVEVERGRRARCSGPLPLG